MRNLILATSLIFSVNAIAAPTAEDLETCKVLSEYAQKMMELRQLEVDVVKLYSLAEGNSVIINMVTSTYEQLPMMGEEAKKRQVAQWGNQYFLKCIKAYK